MAARLLRKPCPICKAAPHSVCEPVAGIDYMTKKPKSDHRGFEISSRHTRSRWRSRLPKCQCNRCQSDDLGQFFKWQEEWQKKWHDWVHENRHIYRYLNNASGKLAMFD